MKGTLGLLLALIVLSLTPVRLVWVQEFHAYEGKTALREGDGGTKKTVNGVDFWSNGAPPHKFKLLGFITDRRHRTGLVGSISMSKLESNVAEVAKKNGGDAVIQVSSDTETTGVVSNNGSAGLVQKQNSKFAVVKYVKETNHAPAGDTALAPVKQGASDVAAPPEK